MAVADAMPARRRSAALGGPARRGAHLLAASGFALAEPLFSLLGENAGFFAVRGSTPVDIVLFALAVAFAVPAALLAVELLAGAVSERAGDTCHLAFLGAFGALFALQGLDRLGVDRTVLLVAGALAAGAALTYAVARLALVRSVLTVLAVAPVVFLALLLFRSEATDLVVPADVEVDIASVRTTTPVVMVILDELPAISLLDEQGEVDSGRFPNFARLARTSTWFRNTSTLSASTSAAVPSLLSGKAPRRDKLPIFESHQENLFTLLGADYRLNVVETQTRLCPRELCPAEDGDAEDRLASLLADALVVYLHVVAPPALEDRLPTVGDAGASLGDDDPEATSEERGGLPEVDLLAFHAERERAFGRFLRSLPDDPPGAVGQPSLNVLHLLLPQAPWLRFPNGRESAAANPRAPGRTGETWRDEGLAHQAHQRHLLQAGYTDALLGRLIARLEETGLWAEALVVVTADHGISFRGGDKRRAATPTNLAELAFVPFFLKLPGQSAGRIVDRHVTTVDVLPTIADALAIPLPWEADGSSALEEGGDAAPEVRVGGAAKPLEVAVDERQAALARQIERFGTRSWGPEFYGTGPHGGLVGQAVEEVGVPTGVEAEAAIGPPLGDLLLALPRRSALVPSPIAATLSGEVNRGDTIAVAVNGEIAGVCTAYRMGDGPVRFSALVPPGAFRPGENQVRVFLVGGPPAAPALSEIRTRIVRGGD